MNSVLMVLEPEELLDALRQDTGRLLLPVKQSLGLTRRAAIRIQLHGRPVVATIVGTVVSTHRNGSAHHVELAPDGDSLRAVQLLSAAARGEEVAFLERPIRYQAKLPVFVGLEDSAICMSTFSVSMGGCGLVWSISAPTMGQSLQLRFAGSRVVDFRGVVCWAQPTRQSSLVGVRLLGRKDAPGVWDALLAEVRRSGAPGT